MNKFSKGLTLLLFFGLIAAFILFKSGYYGGEYQTSPNGAPVGGKSKDSVIVNIDTNVLRLSSSKSIVIVDPVQKKRDSIAIARNIDSLRKIRIARIIAAQKLTDSLGKVDTVKKIKQ